MPGASLCLCRRFATNLTFITTDSTVHLPTPALRFTGLQTALPQPSSGFYALPQYFIIKPNAFRLDGCGAHGIEPPRFSGNPAQILGLTDSTLTHTQIPQNLPLKGTGDLII